MSLPSGTTAVDPCGSSAQEARNGNVIDPTPSMVEVLGAQKSRCGYCGQKASSVSFGVWMHQLSVDDYEALVFAGWRRSGHYLYRPDLRESCCQAWVIRLAAADYEPSSTHKRVLKRLRRAVEPAVRPAAKLNSGNADAVVAKTPPAGPSQSSAGSAGPSSPLEEGVAGICSELQALVCGALQALGHDGEMEQRLVDATVRKGVKVTRRFQGKVRTVKRRRKSTGLTPSLHSPYFSIGNCTGGSGSVEQSAEVSTSCTSNGAAVPSSSADSANLALTPSADNQASLALSCNVALIAAGVERRERQPGAANRANGAGDGDGVERSMEIASGIVSRLTSDDKTASRNVGLRAGISVAAARPGWVNFCLAPEVALAFTSEAAGHSCGAVGADTAIDSSGSILDCSDEKGNPHFSSEQSKILPESDSHENVQRVHRNSESSGCGTMRKANTTCPLRGAGRTPTDIPSEQQIGCESGLTDSFGVSGASLATVRPAGKAEQELAESGAIEDEVGSDSDVECDIDDAENGPSRIPSLQWTDLELSPLPSGREFQMEFVPSQFAADEYQIYRAYQMTVHKSLERECHESSYRRFLVDSPLRHVKTATAPPMGYGSFHVRYMLDGRLFAVGVVDILPSSLSSVYLFYDPAAAALSPGVLSAVKEIEWVSRVSEQCPQLRYYVMGYYIHTCPKMAYKAGFKPSEILCEETRHWVPSSSACAKLSVARDSGKRILRLAPEGVPKSEAAGWHDVSVADASAHVNAMTMVLDDGRHVPYISLERAYGQQLQDLFAKLRDGLGQFLRLVGVPQSRQYLHRLR